MHSPSKSTRVLSLLASFVIIIFFVLEGSTASLYIHRIRNSDTIYVLILRLLNLLVFLILFALCVWSYIQCVITEPGVVTPEAYKEFVEHYGSEYVRGCTYCQYVKLPRTHHCNICQMCVMNMDHHCPWMCNCIGYKNKKFFILFLFYSFVGSLHILLSNSNMLGRSRVIDIRLLNWRLIQILGVTASMAWSIVLIFFGGFHIYLVLANRTTLEFNFSSHNAYNIGMLRNWKFVMDDSPLLWLIPLHSKSFRFRVMLNTIGYESDDDMVCSIPLVVKSSYPSQDSVSSNRKGGSSEV